MNYMEGLNERQKRAVLHTEGPLLIVAGAGAGKTRVITRRILHLIREGVAPESILAITFTNKAAKEMRDRIAHLLSSDLTNRHTKVVSAAAELRGAALSATRSPWIGTFHALGVHIIRENSRRFGIPQHFAIFDREDSKKVLRDAMLRTGRNPKDFEPGKILAAIGREKGDLVRLDEFRERTAGDYYRELIAEVWTEYEKTLTEENALDFDDLLLKTALFLQREEEVRTHYQRRFRYIHIDEYQDTNRAQYMIAKLLADGHKNIAVVGDGDQNIYQWRGATIKNILHFEKDYPQAKVVLLEENYRSTQTILAVANGIIKKNKLRVDKTLFTKNTEGEQVGLFTACDETDEAAFAALKAKQLIAEGVEPREIAALFRANFQSRALEEAFLSANVPYQVLGTRFFERKEVKDAVAYIRAALNPTGLADIRRIINVPARGIGKVTLLKIFAGKESGLPSVMRERIAIFRGLLAELKKKLDAEPLSAALRWIVTASGLEAELKRGGADEEERFENIKELVTFATRYDSLELRASDARTVRESDARIPDRIAAVHQFLADVALQSDQDELKEEKNAVRLMTVHASKGLEFAYVFIVGLEDGLFPHARTNFAEQNSRGYERLRADEPDGDAMEEERRLFYVALTRAKKKIFLSYAGVRTLFGARQVNAPSEFIFDIDEEFLENE